MRRRWIGGGLAEHIEVTNYSATTQQIDLDLELDADAADIFEIRGRVRERRGKYRSTEATSESLVFAYEGLDGLVRRTLVNFSAATVEASRSDDHTTEGSVRLRWTLEVEPGARRAFDGSVRRTCRRARQGRHVEETPARLARSVTGSQADAAAAASAAVRDQTLPPGSPSRRSRRRSTALGRSVRADPLDGELLDLAIRRSIADLRLLRNDGPMHGEHYVRGGRPVVHDAVRARQHHHVAPGPAVHAGRRAETLRVLAAWQATEDDPTATWSPARSSTSCASASSRARASCRIGRTTAAIDSTPLWLILLDETYRWTGDLELVRSLWPNALAALEWIDRYGDQDGDGFVEYERRTPRAC
jgi:hypothetical protein